MSELVAYPDLRGQVAVVTGGASNIGRGIVLALAEQGTNLVLADVDGEQAERTAAEARARGSEVALAIGDLAGGAAPEMVCTTALERFGAIDLLVNNLGWQRPSWFKDLEDEVVDRTISLNLRVPIEMCRAVLIHMAQRRSGSIVNISSDAAFGDLRQSVYGAAKAAIISLSKALAKEYGRYGIRVNVVAPGLVTPPSAEWIGSESLWSGDTPVFDDRGLEAVLKAIPLGRMSEPADIAAAVLFFASNTAARQLTGQVISVSGGYAMPV